MKFPGTGWEQPKIMAKNKAFYGLFQLRSPSRASFICIFMGGGNGLKQGVSAVSLSIRFLGTLGTAACFRLKQKKSGSKKLRHTGYFVAVSALFHLAVFFHDLLLQGVFIDQAKP